MSGHDPVTDQLPDGSTAPDGPAEPGAPSDATTLTAVMSSYEQAGFDAQMAAVEGGMVHCYACGHSAPPRRFELHSLRRLEGASDPDDMLAVAAVSCPRCNANGVLVLNYGPASTPEEADVLLKLEDRRDDGLLPSSQTPAEAEAPSRAPGAE
jgi:hypothetical protein